MTLTFNHKSINMSGSALNVDHIINPVLKLDIKIRLTSSERFI